MKQDGTALFLILIAVALFAALSYAVTQSGRGGGSIDREQAAIDLSQRQQCAASIAHSANKLNVLNGCPKDEISFELPDGSRPNPNNPSDTTCFMFNDAGAAANTCEAYSDSSIDMGLIATVNDTSTIALLSHGVYARCESWLNIPPNDFCFIEMSLDAVNFTRTDNICTKKGAADPDRDENEFARFATDSYCASMCGGPSDSGLIGTSITSVSFYVEDDYSLTPYTGPCQSALIYADCSCW